MFLEEDGAMPTGSDDAVVTPMGDEAAHDEAHTEEAAPEMPAADGEGSEM